MYKRNQTYL